MCKQSLVRKIFLFVTISIAALSAQIKIEYAGNMGVIIRHDNDVVLIDALHEFYRSDYMPTVPAVLKEFTSTENHSNNLRVLLITHSHKDHFSPRLTSIFLARNSNSEVVAPYQTINELYGVAPETVFMKNVTPVYSIDTILTFNNIKIRMIDLKHTAQQRHSAIHNIIYVISIGNKTLVHLGDIDLADEENKKILLQKNIIADVLISPYWLMYEDDFTEWTDHIIKTKKIIIAHISPLEANKFITRYNSSNIVFFSEDGDNLVF